MTAITNNHVRLFKYYHELSDEQHKTIESDYDWLDDPTCENWLVYRDRLYCISDFLSVHNTVYNPIVQDWQEGWDGYISDSFFSAIVIRLYDDPDVYSIGLVLS